MVPCPPSSPPPTGMDADGIAVPPAAAKTAVDTRGEGEVDRVGGSEQEGSGNACGGEEGNEPQGPEGGETGEWGGGEGREGRAGRMNERKILPRATAGGEERTGGRETEAEELADVAGRRGRI